MQFARRSRAGTTRGADRGHHHRGFTLWRAGGGRKGGRSYGGTDELGMNAVHNPVHVHDIHATILHLMGLDPNALTYFYAGLDKKLVGVEGAWPIQEVLA